MRISKFSEPYFLLGSDDTRFWWFDLSTDNRTAYVGPLSNPTPWPFPLMGARWRLGRSMTPK